MNCNICDGDEQKHNVRNRWPRIYYDAFGNQKIGLVNTYGAHPYCVKCHNTQPKRKKIMSVWKLVWHWCKSLWSFPEYRWRIIWWRGNAHYAWCVWKGVTTTLDVLIGG